jgi:hypothetical protein
VVYQPSVWPVTPSAVSYSTYCSSSVQLLELRYTAVLQLACSVLRSTLPAAPAAATAEVSSAAALEHVAHIGEAAQVVAHILSPAGDEHKRAGSVLEGEANDSLVLCQSSLELCTAVMHH